MANCNCTENPRNKSVFSMKPKSVDQVLYNSLNKIIADHVDNCTHDVISICSSFESLSSKSDCPEICSPEIVTVSQEEREFCNPTLNILKQTYRNCGGKNSTLSEEMCTNNQSRSLENYLSSFTQTLTDAKQTESRLQRELLSNVREIIRRPLEATNLEKQLSKLKKIQLIANNYHSDIENVGCETEVKRKQSITDKLGLIETRNYDVEERGFRVLQYKDKIMRQEKEIHDLKAESDAKTIEIKELSAELTKELKTNHRLIQQHQRWESQPILEIIKKILWP